MSTIKNIIEYPEEGLTIRRRRGKFVAFREDDRIEELPQESNSTLNVPQHLGSTQSVAQVFIGFITIN